MTNSEIQKNITKIRAELDSYLAVGDRESLMKTIVMLGSLWVTYFNRDDGLRYTYSFQKIWMDEQTASTNKEAEAPSIFSDVHSVADVVRKSRLIRHALFRLENDFPDELCLEALQTISALNLSEIAFRTLLSGVEDSDKVLARIAELTNTAMK
jgi:hypothetical protein